MKTEHATLEDAIALARRAHLGQTDKAGKDYIEHPLRVMENCRSDNAKIAAILHDVVEDSDCSLDDLRQMNFAPEVVEAVALLTKTDGIEYSNYIAQIKNNALAREVKIADLRDNMDLSRIAQPTEKDFKRLEKYRGALAILEG
ncbi:MAG TPA: HD domain-containing protein [Abditibacteriaceae bacterium]|jgi:(p)ppGpp synthase/HD superfamily hydrolase|nr:HD domain-containing protein [Abditibacteriaceae bacterium]